MIHKEIYERVYEGAMEVRACGAGYAPGIRCVIAVSGAAALGKTTFCRGFAGFLRSKDVSAAHVQLDGFLFDRRVRKKMV